MRPVLVEVLEVSVGTHESFVALGLAVAVLVFKSELRRRGVDDPRLWAVVAVSLSWGALFMYAGNAFCPRCHAERPGRDLAEVPRLSG